MLNRRDTIKSIVLAALGLVGRRKKKPNLFVMDLPNGMARFGNNKRDGSCRWAYTTYGNHPTLGDFKFIKFPKGHWKYHQIVFEKVED